MKTIIIVKTNVRAEFRTTIGAFPNKYEAIKYLWNLEVDEYYRTSWDYYVSPYQWWFEMQSKWYGIPYIFEEIPYITLDK